MQEVLRVRRFFLPRGGQQLLHCRQVVCRHLAGVIEEGVLRTAAHGLRIDEGGFRIDEGGFRIAVIGGGPAGSRVRWPSAFPPGARSAPFPGRTLSRLRFRCFRE